MPTTRRVDSNARHEIFELLKKDHQSVKKAYRAFTKLDPETDAQECEAIARQVLAELQVHAAIEEELLYPAARAALDTPDLIDEAEVEHECAHTLINQLNEMAVSDEKFVARFTVLCEYVMHHVKEEEDELFPELEKADGIDWPSLSAQMMARREELAPVEIEEEEEEEEAEQMKAAGAAAKKPAAKKTAASRGR